MEIEKNIIVYHVFFVIYDITDKYYKDKTDFYSRKVSTSNSMTLLTCEMDKKIDFISYNCHRSSSVDKRLYHSFTCVKWRVVLGNPL